MNSTAQALLSAMHVFSHSPIRPNTEVEGFAKFSQQSHLYSVVYLYWSAKH